MRLQIISINNSIGGFLIVESIMVISLFSIFIISALYFKISIDKIKFWSINELPDIEDKIKILDQFIKNDNYKGEYFGNYTKLVKLFPFEFTKSDLLNSWGSSSCYPRIKYDNSNLSINNIGIDIGLGNKSTNIEIRNSYVYLSADSSITSLPDLYIIDNKDDSKPYIVSSMNTGPGIASLTVAGPYLYLANTSINSHLQILDIHDRNSPHIISQLKLPLPNASTTPTRSASISYNNGYVFLGTNKWDGPELSIIDVKDPSNPIIVGTFDTDTLINDIFVYDDKAYLATSDIYQMRVLDITDKSAPKLHSIFTSSGWQVQQGKVISLFENLIILGRTVGGINRTNNHELFLFSTSTSLNMTISRDIPSGVYGLIVGSSDIFVLTHDINREFQIWSSDLLNKKYEIGLNSSPISMKCDRSKIYFATGDSRGFISIKL